MSKMALNWLTTEAGRKFTRTAVGILGGAGFGVYLLPHTYYLDKTKEIVQMYKHGAPVPLDNTTKARTDEVLQDLTYLLDREKNSITFFTVYGPDVFHKGSTQLRSGAIIGLPINYSYANPGQVERSQLQLGRHPNFNWQSETGHKLIESLILQPHAQKFAIAREIVYSNTNYVYTNAFLAVSSFLAAYMTGNFINRTLHFYERARKQRMIMYGILSAMGGVLYMILTDALSVHYDRHVDGKVANLGKEYVMGGIEYYQKVLDRNKAIRRALGETGEGMYTAQGNENEWIRVRHIPLTARLDYMKGRLKEYERRKIPESPIPGRGGEPASPAPSRGEPSTITKPSQLEYMSRGTPPPPPPPTRSVPSTQTNSPTHSASTTHVDPLMRSVPPVSPTHSVSTVHTTPNIQNSSITSVPRSIPKHYKPNVDKPTIQTSVQIPPPSPPPMAAPRSQLNTPHDPHHVCKTHQKQSFGHHPAPLPPTSFSPQNQSPQHYKPPVTHSSFGNQPSRSYSPHIPPPTAPTQHSTTHQHQSPAATQSTPLHQTTTSSHSPSIPTHQTTAHHTSAHQTSGQTRPNPTPVHQTSTSAQPAPQVKLTSGQSYPRNSPVLVDGIAYNVGIPQETHERVQMEASTPSIIPELFRATFSNIWQILVNL